MIAIKILDEKKGKEKMRLLKTNIADLAENKKMLYRLTMGESKGVAKMTDEELDCSYPVDAYLFYEKEDKDGKPVQLLTILSGQTVITAQSSTLQKAFSEIVDLMGDDDFAVRFESGNSKNGRRFVYCVLDCD